MKKIKKEISKSITSEKTSVIELYKNLTKFDEVKWSLIKEVRNPELLKKVLELLNINLTRIEDGRLTKIVNDVENINEIEVVENDVSRIDYDLIKIEEKYLGQEIIEKLGL